MMKFFYRNVRIQADNVHKILLDDTHAGEMLFGRELSLLLLALPLFPLALSARLLGVFSLPLLWRNETVLHRFIIVWTAAGGALAVQLRVLSDIVVAELADLVAAGTGFEVSIRDIHFLNTKRTEFFFFI